MSATTSTDVVVYAHGLCYLSVCARVGTAWQTIEAEANREFPTGISSRWEITTEDFASGESNPHLCESDRSREHWLLSC